MKSWKEKFKESEEFNRLTPFTQAHLSSEAFNLHDPASITRDHMEHNVKILTRQIKHIPRKMLERMYRKISKLQQEKDAYQRAIEKLDRILEEEKPDGP